MLPFINISYITYTLQHSMEFPYQSATVTMQGVTRNIIRSHILYTQLKTQSLIMKENKKAASTIKNMRVKDFLLTCKYILTTFSFLNVNKLKLSTCQPFSKCTSTREIRKKLLCQCGAIWRPFQRSV